MSKTDGNGRKQFDAIDMLRQAMGLPTPEGYAVITKEFAGFLVQELERLYGERDNAATMILWKGVGEWGEFNGTPDDALAEVLRDNNFSNYGRSGAVIVEARMLFKVNGGGDTIILT